MARKSASAKNTPEKPKEDGVVAAAAPAEPAKKSNPQKYYRIRKITSYLSEIVEVEVDEAVIVPKAVSKQDLRELLMVRLEDYIYGPRKK